MISNVLKWFFLVASGGILFVALSPETQRWLDQKHLIPNQYSHGDLYNITNLRAFREANFGENTNLVDADIPKKHKDVHLYTIGDSFTAMDTVYYAGGRNRHVWVGEKDAPTVAPLDTTKKNILVIEFIERVLQERLYKPDYEKIYIQNGFAQTAQPVVAQPKPVEESTVKSWLLARFGSDINQRLEFLLFNTRPFIWFKEMKAQLLLDLFGRVPGAVISQDKKHLFYQPEANNEYILSAFRPLSDQRLDTLVTNLNTIRQHYLHMGFDEVYVCMIPNKVTILDPTYGQYNHQIERIEANPRLQAPILTMIDTLRQHPEWYHLGDGHWNKEGKRFWLRRVNQLAATWSSDHD
ncbi:hypothetical protein BH09BAC4_BH09BAC4_23120 [soil metagenome]